MERKRKGKERQGTIKEIKRKLKGKEREKGNRKRIFHCETWQRSFQGDRKGIDGKVGIRESLSFI